MSCSLAHSRRKCFFCGSFPPALHQEYLHRARRYLELPQQVDELLVGAAREVQEPIAPGNIRGVWVVSDDPVVLEEVKRLAPRYFPGGSVYGWAKKKTEEKRIGGSLSVRL